jgi:importin subunit beta-1
MLQLVTSVATNKIGPLIDPLLQRDLYSEDWARQEVAITILGLILTEEHYDYIEEKLPSIVPQVLALLRHTNVNVRSSAAFTLRCICNGYASSIGEHKKAVVQTILGSVRDEDRVRRHIYTCIINAESEDLFEQDFSQLAHALVESLGAPNADIPVIFEAIASLVNAQENIDPIKPLVPFILQSLQQNFDDAVVVATAVIRKLKQDLEPYADQFMSLYIARFPNNVSEEVLMAIGYTAQAAGERFAKYLPSLMPLILPLLADVQQPQIFGPTLGVFIDIFQNTKGAISPYCDTIMNALLVALQAPDVDPQYKPEALSLLGDIAAGIGGGAYEKYMPQVQQVLTQAGHVILGQNNLEDEQHIALQQYLISTWTSLFQNFHHNPAILMENLPQILQVIIKTVQGYQNTQDAANAVYLVGDILQCCNQAKVYISALPELQNCLGLACNSTNKTVTAAAEWVLQLMNNKL